MSEPFTHYFFQAPRLYDWALVQWPRFQQAPTVLHALLLCRSLSDPTEMAYDVVLAPGTVSLATLVRVAGQRWKVEECFELAKSEVGLDHYEVRHWLVSAHHPRHVGFSLADDPTH